MAMSNPGTNSEEELIDRQIRSSYDCLVQHRYNDTRTEESRQVCRKAKAKFSEEGLDYNLITACNEKYLGTMNELKDKNKMLENEIQSLKAANVELKEEIKAIKEENFTSAVAIKVLEENNKRLKGENVKLEKTLEKCTAQIKVLNDSNVKLKEENATFKAEIKAIKEENLASAVAIKVLEENNKRLKEENVKIALNTRPLRDDRGVKLFVFYNTKYFCPVSCPEVHHLGEIKLSGFHFTDFIKCQIPSLREGWNTSEVVLNALKPLFTIKQDGVVHQGFGYPAQFSQNYENRRQEIRGIRQFRGTKDGRQFVEVTSLDDDEPKKWKVCHYCGPDGFRAEGLGQGGIYICGEGRRTVVTISI